MAPGQVENLVLLCPHCNRHNAVVDIPVIEIFVSQLQSIPQETKSLPKFKKVLAEGLARPDPAEYVAEVIEKNAPEFNWFKEYLVPSNAGETYAMLGCILAFVTWYQTRPKKNKETPQAVVKTYFINTDSYKSIGRNGPCPCNSGKSTRNVMERAVKLHGIMTRRSCGTLLALRPRA